MTEQNQIISTENKKNYSGLRKFNFVKFGEFNEKFQIGITEFYERSSVYQLHFQYQFSKR